MAGDFGTGMNFGIIGGYKRINVKIGFQIILKHHGFIFVGDTV
jgi:hypothetical protein